ncbi:MAG TPA: glycogen/starch/alpha-glucan phosphorylase [Candidatus Limiplasma sp.]|nr:glycogen/starch/alpha-glucan phosphorylase [Candidatus Limiplasma sp.]HPS80775.1 glycogen/starch/alpha-glucan phosphorylase [Candidatus Limiplasma sp.]
MPATKFDVEGIKQSIVGKLQRYYGVTTQGASLQQLYKATASTVRDQIMQKWMISREERAQSQGKRLYYLSVEFLMGRSLNSNLINLCSQENYRQALSELSIDPLALLAEEPEPALGNGGLGRLAACFLDSLSSLNIPSMGCTIRYEYGLFRQKIVDGQQVELPDTWLQNGNVWEIVAAEDICQVQFGGEVREVEVNGRKNFSLENAYTIDAVPYDMPIVGYDTDCVNTLRTWSARSCEVFDLKTFGRGEYDKAMDEMKMAEVINKVLYPEDSHWEGKMLRMKQHYFFTSATLQYALKDFKRQYGNNFDLLPDKVVFHINDTHPGLAIPELIRLLIDQEGLGWEEAESITHRCMAYTNHTVMQEALERWPQNMMKQTLPRIFMILEELNRRLCEKLFKIYPDQWERIGQMAILAYGQVHMANLCVAIAFSVNGVSQLHGKILTDGLFHDYWLTDPGKFSAITNGITHRRWLLSANPGMRDLIAESIGTGFYRDAQELEKLLPFADDAAFRQKFEQVKQQNKERFARMIGKRQCETLDPTFIFDVQAKRLHEYKRQLLNALHIQVLYNRIVEDANFSAQPRLFLFGAKAAPGYYRAKLIIRYINALAALIDSHPRARKFLKVVYIENYDVSTAELLMPAAEISQQLSTAGKEASGTGNMKFMMNGALTLGTMDGANVEIYDQVGSENIYIFGMRAETVEGMYKEGSYNPMGIFETNAELRRALSQWLDGTLFPDEPMALQDLYHMLLMGDYGGMPDEYFVLKDFGSYSMANRRMMEDYVDRDKWLKKSIINVAKSGYFSSDRTIGEYNSNIWHIKPI